MPKSRLILISFLLMLTGPVGIYYFYERSYDADEPLELFLAAQYPESLKSLEINKGAFATADYYLQKSYIFNQLGFKDEAEGYLLAILNSPLGGPSPHFLAEVYFNLMLSAYQDRDFDEMNRYLKNVQRFSMGKDEWILLFMGISFYQEGNFEKAFAAFAPIASFGYLSPWMEKRFSASFTPCWLAKHLVHCQIELGNLTDARRMLDQMEGVFFPDNVQELYYLSGLSFLAEAEVKPPDLAIPLYRHAISYLKRMNESALRGTLQELLVKGVQKDIESLLGGEDSALGITRETDQFVLSYLPFYIQTLEEWGNKDQIAGVQGQLIKMFDQEKWQRREDAFNILSMVLKDSMLRKMMGLRFENLLERALQKDQIDCLQTYWRGIIAFCDQQEIPYGNFSDKAIQKALCSIIHDDAQLSRTDRYLDFYLLVEDNPDESFQFARQLEMIAEQLWEIPHERQKAMNLLKAAKKVVPNSRLNDLHQTVENFFARRYSNALNQDQMAELFHLVSAADVLKIASVDAPNKQEIEQKIEEAQYLYQQGRLDEAETKAEWVLKINPDDKQARRILGMAAYYNADYRMAEDLLRGIEPINHEMKAAYAVIAIVNGQKKKGLQWLEEVKRQHPVELFIYYRIIYGLLEDEKPLKALEWLSNIPKGDPGRIPARIIAAYQMNSWQEVIDFFKLLQPPYANLDGYYGLVIDSLIALGDEKKAEEYLNQLLKRPKEPEINSFPPYFQAFKKNVLDQWSRFFVAGSFYKNVKKQLSEALIFYNKIENPSVLAKIEIAEIYYQLGRFSEAKELLLNIDKENGAQKEVKQEILPMLASSFAQLGYLIESIPYYEEYFQLAPKDANFRYAYIKALMDLRRYDLALKQIEVLRTIRELEPEESFAWLEILFHQGKFSQVDQLANEWLSNQAVPLYYQLQIADLMVFTNNRETLGYILKGLPDPSQRSITDNQQLIRVFSDLGQYDKALDLAQLLEKKLVNTPEGLMVLATLYMKLSESQKSLNYIDQALQLNPGYLKALNFRERYEESMSMIVPQIELLKKRIDENPDYPTLQIAYAKSLIKLGIEEYLSGAISSIHDSLDLKQARLTLEKLKEKIIALPEVHLLLGKIYLLLNLSRESEEQFQIALKLDPSFIEALQHLALVYEESNQIDEAISTLVQAIKFAPNNGDVWEQIGNLYVAEKDWKSAVNAYQQAIRFSPFDPDPYLRLAQTYLIVTRPADAVKTLEALLAFSSENREGLMLILRALYDTAYIKQNKDPELLQRNRIEYYDRLRLIDPDQAKNALPEGVSLEPKE